MSVELLGLNIDALSFSDAVARALELIKSEDKVSQVVTINPEMFFQAEVDADFSRIVREAEMVVPDGVGVKIALKLKGQTIQRIPGIDLARKLLEECAKENIPVAIIGAKEDVLVQAVNNLKKEIQGLNIVFSMNGYFTNDEEVYSALTEKAPRLILVAMGSPRQERFIYNAKSCLSSALLIGIGGSLDVWSGSVKRAPKIFRRMGLEWLYRTVLQPERIKRIFPALPLFLLKVLLYKK